MRFTLFSRSVLAVALSTVMGAALAFEMPTLTPQQAERFKAAQAAYSEQKFGEAAKLLKQSVDAQRPHPYAVVLFGLCVLEEGKTKEAVTVFKKGLSLYPDYLTLVKNAAVVFSRAEDFVLAAETFLKAEKLAPKKDQARLRLQAAQSYWQGQKVALAQKTLEPLAESKDATLQVLRLAGTIAVRQNQWTKAERYYSRAVNLKPEDTNLWRTLASVRLRIATDKKKSLVSGAAALEMGVALSDDKRQEERDLRALAGLYEREASGALTLSALERSDALAKDLPKPSAKDAKPITKRERLEREMGAAIRLGHTREALSKFESWYALTKDSKYDVLAGSLYRRLGDNATALARFKRAMGVAGHVGRHARMQAASLLWEAGDLKGAIALLDAIPEDEVHPGIERMKTTLLTLEKLERESYQDPFQKREPIKTEVVDPAEGKSGG